MEQPFIGVKNGNLDAVNQRIVNFLSRKKLAKSREIEQAVNLTKNAISRRMEALIKSGIVAKKPDPLYRGYRPSYYFFLAGENCSPVLPEEKIMDSIPKSASSTERIGTMLVAMAREIKETKEQVKSLESLVSSINPSPEFLEFLDFLAEFI